MKPPYLFLLLAALAVAGPALAATGADARLERADANKDGRVSRAEFAAERAGRFDALDRNHDGVVSFDDFRRLARRSDRVKAMIGAADRNGDRRVTREEFAKAPMPVFDRADANRDGMLDRAELASVRGAR